jgi:hypothetical protein
MAWASLLHAFTASLHLAPRAVYGGGQSYANSGILRRGMMSALGQKQTCAARKGMSALPPKATSNATQGNVCAVPKADIAATVAKTCRSHRSRAGSYVVPNLGSRATPTSRPQQARSAAGRAFGERLA